MRRRSRWLRALAVAAVLEGTAATAAATAAGASKAAAEGHHHHHHKGPDDGIDIDGLQNSLKNGGIEGLSNMLNAFQAMHDMGSSDAAMHIKKDAQGHDIYDFTTETPAPTPAPAPAPAPVPQVPVAALPNTAAPVVGKGVSAANPAPVPQAMPASVAGPKAPAPAPATLRGSTPPTAPMAPVAPMAPAGPVASPAMPMAGPAPGQWGPPQQMAAPAGAQWAPAPGQWGPPSAPAAPQWGQQMMAPTGQYMMGPVPQMAGISDGLYGLRQGMEYLINRANTGAAGGAGVGEQGQSEVLQGMARRLDSLEHETRELKMELKEQGARLETVEAKERRTEKALSEVKSERNKLRSQLSATQQSSRVILRQSVKPLETLVASVESQLRNLDGVRTYVHQKMKLLARAPVQL